MIKVKLCNPNVPEPFKQFVHNTTTYVAVPHDSPFQLFVQSQPGSTLRIFVRGHKLVKQVLPEGQAILPLSDLTMPHEIGSLRDWINLVMGRPKPQPVQQRLYQFCAHVSRPGGEKTTATFAFHILCPEEFEVARAVHLRLQTEPDAIAPKTISELVEGHHCVQCQTLKEALDKLKT